MAAVSAGDQGFEFVHEAGAFAAEMCFVAHVGLEVVGRKDCAAELLRDDAHFGDIGVFTFGDGALGVGVAQLEVFLGPGDAADGESADVVVEAAAHPEGDDEAIGEGVLEVGDEVVGGEDAGAEVFEFFGVFVGLDEEPAGLDAVLIGVAGGAGFAFDGGWAGAAVGHR